MRAAIYARVSTERQERQQTIDSQLTALRDWARAQTHALAEVHVFRDEGYSGSRLDRPGLDGLRDAVRDAAIDVVAVFSPDRLARKYAYQVLLLEEFRRAGCEVVFLHHPISDDPNDQLLLQIQGAIAEYERAVLAERFRRGKLQKARDGNIISSKVPYGYRYEARNGAVPARLVVDEQASDGVAATMARNALLSFRRNKKHDYMLRCLLKCGRCGLGIHGCYFPGHGGRVGRRYYRCAGTDALTTAREAKCPRARIEAEPLEQAVWGHVVGLLRDPAQLQAQFERFLAEAEGPGAEDAAGVKLRARLDRLDRADQRLLEAYQAEVISLDELSGQRRAL